MGLLLGIAILAADAFAIIKTIQSRAAVGEKYLWVFLICLLPVLGFVLWLFKGPKD